MSKPPLRALSILLAIATIPLASCSSTYMKSADGAHRAMYRGDYKRAINLINAVKPAQKDALLHLMDKGMILHAAGHYEESNKVLFEAEDLAKGIRSKSLSREVGATLGSEEATEYSGDNHEVVMIAVTRMLNFLMLDDWNSALVEVRRVGNIAADYYGSSKNFDNAFAIYLSAVIWETLGHLNDAYIDYKRLASLNKNIPYYSSDLKSSAKRLGLSANLPQKLSTPLETPENYRSHGAGELIVILQSGRSPKFVSEYVSDGLITMAVPIAFVWPDSPAMADVIVDGKSIGGTYPFYNVSDDVMRAMKSRQKRTLVRKIIKSSVQTGLYGASYNLMKSDDSAEQGLGLALGIAGLLMSASEKADERSWRTLPAHYEIGRFYLKPGKSEVSVVSRSGAKIVSKDVEISKEKPVLILAHVPWDGIDTPKRYAAKQSEQKNISEKERTISKEIRKRPSDGNLKIDLAEAKIENGDYDIEKLLLDGISQGGDNIRGYSLLTVSLAVKGDYIPASKTAQKAGLTSYADALAYAGGEKSSAPKSSYSPSEGRVKGFSSFTHGLVAEKDGNHKEACRLFLKSYEDGLKGKPVIKKTLAALGASGDDFKKSAEGRAIADKFIDEYLEMY
ncbi:MAG TPA: hypothetical protein PK599_01535 [bacterium]|nr:hypothetical protein [bacterium]